VDVGGIPSVDQQQMAQHILASYYENCSPQLIQDAMLWILMGTKDQMQWHQEWLQNPATDVQIPPHAIWLAS